MSQSQREYFVLREKRVVSRTEEAPVYYNAYYFIGLDTLSCDSLLVEIGHDFEKVRKFESSKVRKFENLIIWQFSIILNTTIL
jgi:hypothetical protein